MPALPPACPACGGSDCGPPSEPEIDLELAQQIMDEGAADVECDACGYGARIEPDGDYKCPECGEGRLTSPLREWGLI